MAKTINVTMQVQVPGTPNFLRRTDGSTVPLSAIKEDGLREIGRLWTEELVIKAKKKRDTDS